MAGLGRKTFNSGDILLASEVQGYLQDQAVMVFAGTASRSSAIPTPSEGMVTYRTDDDVVEVYDGSAFVPVGGAISPAVISSTTGSPSITSGTVISGVTYDLYDFTGSGSVVIDEAGFVDFVLVGGGGSGGNSSSGGSCGGGGAGGLLQFTDAYISAGTASVIVGAGGPASIKMGITSRFGPYYAVGGGGGQGGTNDGGNRTAIGGSGGGNGPFAPTQNFGIPGQGNDGGPGQSNYSAPGGGGASAAGGAGGVGSTGGVGGAGLTVTITGGSIDLAGGGGGAGQGAGGAGGLGGGGAGTTTNGVAGTVNTGGGGGGSRGNGNNGGAGGSGRFILRVKV